MELAHLIHRIATDPAFAGRLRADPQAALQQANITLDPHALSALLTVLNTPGLLENLLSDDQAGTGDPQWPAFVLHPHVHAIDP